MNVVRNARSGNCGEDSSTVPSFADENLPAHLTAAIKLVRNEGPKSAYAALRCHKPLWVRGLAQAYFTKLLYFAGYGAKPSVPQPLIMDNFIVKGLTALTKQPWEESQSDYMRWELIMIGMPSPYDRVAHIERFNEYLIRAVVSGEFCTGGGAMVDHQTMGAIDQVAAAHPDPDPALIRAARVEFAKELDGTHAAEDRAWWRAHLGARYSAWPQTPFSVSVKTAFDHMLTFVNGPWAPEELDYARKNLDSAAPAGAAGPQLSRQALIVMLLRLMIDAVAVIPDCHVGEDTDEAPRRRFAERTRVALKYLRVDP